MSPDSTCLYRSLAGRRVGVLGLGRSGLASARCCMDAGARVMAWDDDATQRTKAAKAGIPVQHFDWGAGEHTDDLLIVSPGIPHRHPVPHPLVTAARAAGVAVDNDIGLLFHSLAVDCPVGQRPKVVAITGSNGKSTTAALLHHLLCAGGHRAELAGNIGFPVAAITKAVGTAIMVLELSSYQCELARCLDPDIAVFLNFSPDHLDRHGGVAGYLAAKRRMLAGPRLNLAIVGLDEAEGRGVAETTAARIGAARVIGIADGDRQGPGRVIPCTDDHLVWARDRGAATRVDLTGAPGLRGRHNVLNAAAALAVVDGLGIPIEDVLPALTTFPGLPHRSQHVGTWRGITVINDSKATNAASALQGLRAYGNIRWIAGGRAKEEGIAPLVDHLAHVRKAYLVGEAARDFARELAITPHEICGTMARAVMAAVRDARPGETILLAPAAASFDQYPDFEARGNDFVARIRACFSPDARECTDDTMAEETGPPRSGH